jgi:NAD+ kinase
VIVVGGDGSLLNAAHIVVDENVPVVGINRGRLGFLTDIHPDLLESYLKEILHGHYLKEQRFLLDVTVEHQGQINYQNMALNEMVLLPGQYSHMLEFEIYIDGQRMCSQRADGQIIATPTGSTGYALSGGGPILHPALDALVLVPMFPHRLSSRPIVVNGNCEIDIVLIPRLETSPQINCDGQSRVSVALGDTIKIKKKPEKLTLLHPKNYNYYETLRKKLHWEHKG